MRRGHSADMILGIDLGSTVFKTELFDRDLRRLGRGAAPVVYHPAAGNGVEMPVAAAEDALRTAIADALGSAGCRPESLAAVAIASQAQTFAVRGSDGRAKGPFISWRDTRCEHDNPASALSDFSDHCSFADALPGLTVSKLAFLQRESAGARIGPGDQVLWLPTWFVAQFVGRAVVDDNLAAMSGLYSMRAAGWWPEAMALCGIAPQQLPALVPLGTSAGLVCAAGTRYGLPEGTPVILAGNDQTAAAYGAGLHESDSVLIGLGTAQVVYATYPQMLAPTPGLLRGPYPGGRFYRLGADDWGSGTVSWACRTISGLADVKDFDRAVSVAPEDCHGVRFIADGPAGSGHWTGLDNPEATPDDQARAVIVTLVERMAAMFDKLDAAGPVLLCGGGAESAPWRECLSRRLGVRLAKMPDVSPSRGAARMARDWLAARSSG